MGKVTSYIEITSPTSDDQLFLVDNPGGSPASKKASLGNLYPALNLGWTDVRAYGAKGDGLTDDTAAIQAAIDSCTLGGTIYFPPLIYLIDSKIIVNKKITLWGGLSLSATNPQLLKKSTLNDMAIDITGEGVGINGLFLLGQGGNGGDGISVRAANVSLSNIFVNSMGGNGIRIGDDGATNSNLFYLQRIRSTENGGHGLYIHSNTGLTPDANSGMVLQYFAESNIGDGLRVGNARLNMIVGSYTAVNSGYGVNFQSTSIGNILLGGQQWESNTLGDVKDDGTGNIFIGTLNTSPILGSGIDRLILPCQSSEQAEFKNIRVHASSGNPSIHIGETLSLNSLRLMYEAGGHYGLVNAVNAIGGIAPLYIDGTPIYLNLSIGSDGKVNISGLPIFANNAAALNAGYPVGSLYRSGGDPDIVYIVH